MGQAIYVSATPAEYELERAQAEVGGQWREQVGGDRLAGGVAQPARLRPGLAIDALARAHRRDPDCFRVLISRTLEAAPLIRGLNLGVIDALLQAPVAMETAESVRATPAAAW